MVKVVSSLNLTLYGIAILLYLIIYPLFEQVQNRRLIVCCLWYLVSPHYFANGLKLDVYTFQSVTFTNCWYDTNCEHK